MLRITKVNIAGQIYNLQDERLDEANIKWSTSFNMNNFKEASKTVSFPLMECPLAALFIGRLSVSDCNLSPLI